MRGSISCGPIVTMSCNSQLSFPCNQMRSQEQAPFTRHCPYRLTSLTSLINHLQSCAPPETQRFWVIICRMPSLLKQDKDSAYCGNFFTQCCPDFRASEKLPGPAMVERPVNWCDGSPWLG